MPREARRRGRLLLDKWDNTVPDTIKNIKSQLYTDDADARRNARVTVYSDGEVADARVASRNIFRDTGWEKMDKHDYIDKCKDMMPAADYLQICDTGIVPAWLLATERHIGQKRKNEQKEENVERSRRRAKQHIYNYIRDNSQLDMFCTLTVSPEHSERFNADALGKKLHDYLSHRVSRRGLQYVAVYEYHKHDNALHVHMLCNQSALKLQRAINYRTGKKLSHQDAHGHWHAIYNVSDWQLGFTTAIKCYGNRDAVAHYISKYVSKSEKKIRGRWYMHSHNLTYPEYRYYQCDYAKTEGNVQNIERANLHIKYTTPEQLAKNIDWERMDTAKMYYVSRETQHISAINGTFTLPLDRAPEGQLSSAAGDLDRTSKKKEWYAHSDCAKTQSRTIDAYMRT